MLSDFNIFNKSLNDISLQKALITTINAHSYNVSLNDPVFRKALRESDVLLPDGISIVWAMRWLTNERLKKIAGAELFEFELRRLQKAQGKCFFLGSTNETLQKIKTRIANEFPNIRVETYSPPYKVVFSEEDNAVMLNKINSFKPDVLMIGLTAPKQEKWAHQHFDALGYCPRGVIG